MKNELFAIGQMSMHTVYLHAGISFIKTMSCKCDVLFWTELETFGLAV